MSLNPAPVTGAPPAPAGNDPQPAAVSGEVRLIRARQGFTGFHLREVWRYRELFGFLVWRDILIRYKQTYLGVAWAVIQPVLYMVVFSCVGRLAKFPTHGVPYPLISLAGLLPWQFFSTALTDSSNSLLASSNMISKVYFPRLIVPAAAVMSGAVDFFVSFVLFLIVQACYRAPFHIELLLIPFFFFYTVLAALAAGLWFSALSVRYRDIKYIVPFVTRLGLYACPVAFVSTIVPARWHFWYSLNPLVGIIDGFRWCTLGPDFAPDPIPLLIGFLLTATFVAAGMAYFRTTERHFADII